MTIPLEGIPIWAIVLVVFQAGGVFWLAKNHISHVNRRIGGLSKREKRHFEQLDGRLRTVESLSKSTNDVVHGMREFMIKEAGWKK